MYIHREVDCVFYQFLLPLLLFPLGACLNTNYCLFLLSSSCLSFKWKLTGWIVDHKKIATCVIEVERKIASLFMWFYRFFSRIIKHIFGRRRRRRKNFHNVKKINCYHIIKLPVNEMKNPFPPLDILCIFLTLPPKLLMII